MSDLRKLLSEADRVPAPDLWPDIRERRPRPRGRSRQVVAGAVALALAASGIALVSVAFLGDRERPPVPRNAAGMEVDPRITAEVPVGDFPQEVAVGEGAVWVTVNQAAPSVRWFVARIDPATNQVTDEIDVPGASDIAAGDGSVWVAGYPARDPQVDPALYRIDPATREVVAEITLPCAPYCGVHQVALGEDAVWITLANTPDSGEVVRVDPRTNEIVARIAVSGDPRDLVIEGGSVWVFALGQGGALHRIDARTNELAATLLQGQIYSSSGVNSPPILAAGFGHVWIGVGDGDPMEVARIDPETGEIAGQPIVLPLDETLFQPFSTEAGGVWFRGGQQGNRPLIGRLNPVTLTVDETLRLDRTVINDGTIDPESGTMWLTNLRRIVTRIDLRPDPGQETAVDPRVTAEIAVGQFPQEVAVGEGAVWVTVNDADAPERWFVARIDPATNRVTDEVDLRDAVDVAVGAGSVWAITYDGTTGWAVARIDPTLRTITGVIPLDCHRGCGATQVAATDDAVWVTSSPDSSERGEVIRIDPLTNQVAARIGVTGDPRDLAVGEGGVWVYALSGASSSRGSTSRGRRRDGRSHGCPAGTDEPGTRQAPGTRSGTCP